MSNTAPKWQVIIAKRPQKMLRRVPRPLRRKMHELIWSLAENPILRGAKKLAGYRNMYRLRVGDWRIVYVIQEKELIVLIVTVAPRGGAYRDL